MEKCLCGRWFKSRRAMFGHVGSCKEYAAFKEWMDGYKATNSAEELRRWSERAGKMVPWGWKDYYNKYVEIYGYNRLEKEKSRSRVKAVHESHDAKIESKILKPKIMPSTRISTSSYSRSMRKLLKYSR